MIKFIELKSDRKYYLDNIRWIVILMVILFHVFSYYNNVGVAPNFSSSIDSIRADGSYPLTFASVYQYSVYQWFMLLLFIISGICSYYAIQKKGIRLFLKERTKKLLIPSTVGIAVLWWISGKILFEQYEVLESVPIALRYVVYCLLGIGQFWFLHVLYLCSVLLYLIKKIIKNDKIHDFFESTPFIVNITILLALAVPAWLTSKILNLPEVTLYRFGIYTFAYLSGYFIFSCDNMLDTLRKTGPICLFLGMFLTFMYVRKFYGTYYYEQIVLQDPVSVLSAWMMCLGIIGTAQISLNFSNNFTKYINKVGFGIYITHLFVILLVNKFMIPYANHININMIYIITAIFAYAGSIFLYESLKNIPIVCYLFFGYEKEYNFNYHILKRPSNYYSIKKQYVYFK